MLILDLDNTIFETNSISPELFNPIFEIIQSFYNSNGETEKATKIIAELWTTPMDSVFEKYTTPKVIQDQAYDKLNDLDFKLQIETYADYDVLNKFNHQKILVTTGFEKLQKAKIQSLKIESDFNKIFIDDPLSKARKYKLGIFKKILEQSQLEANEIWVIGDSVENEIKAGKKLGMNTIQRLKKGTEKSKYSDFGIETFHELIEILK